MIKVYIALATVFAIGISGKYVVLDPAKTLQEIPLFKFLK